MIEQGLEPSPAVSNDDRYRLGGVALELGLVDRGGLENDVCWHSGSSIDGEAHQRRFGGNGTSAISGFDGVHELVDGDSATAFLRKVT